MAQSADAGRHNPLLDSFWREYCFSECLSTLNQTILANIKSQLYQNGFPFIYDLYLLGLLSLSSFLYDRHTSHRSVLSACYYCDIETYYTVLHYIACFWSVLPQGTTQGRPCQSIWNSPICSHGHISYTYRTHLSKSHLHPKRSVFGLTAQYIQSYPHTSR